MVNDDVMLGDWLAAAPRRREAFNVTYAFVTSITPNADCPKRGRGNGLYKAPNNVSILLHHIKNPSWLPYVWRVAAEGLEYQPEECARARVLSPQRSPGAATCVARFGSAGHTAGPGQGPPPAGAARLGLRYTSTE